MKKIKTQLNNYLNMNVIELSKVIILNYGYGTNIIWQNEMFQCTFQFQLVVWTITLRCHCMSYP